MINPLIQQDIEHEWNPFLVLLAGKGALLVVKIVGATVRALILWDIYIHWPRLGLVSAYVFLLVYSGIVVWNLSLYLGARA